MTKISKINLPIFIIILVFLFGAISLALYALFFVSWESGPLSNIYMLILSLGLSGIFIAQLLKIKIVYKKDSHIIVRNLFGYWARIDKDNVLSISGESRTGRYNAFYSVINISIKGKKKIVIDGRYLRNMHEVRRALKTVSGH